MCVNRFRMAHHGLSHRCPLRNLQAIRSDNPVIFFEHVLLYNVKGVPKGRDHVQCLEKAELVREGTDCVIFTYSRMRYVVMQVCQACNPLPICDSRG